MFLSALEISSSESFLLDSTYKWYHIIFVFFCLTYFTYYYNLYIHPCFYKWLYFVFFRVLVIYIYIYIYICIYTHTHTHTHTNILHTYISAYSYIIYLYILKTVNSCQNLLFKSGTTTLSISMFVTPSLTVRNLTLTVLKCFFMDSSNYPCTEKPSSFCLN